MYRKFSIQIGKEEEGATRKELIEHGFPDPYFLELRFTSMNKLRELAGFELQSLYRRVYTKHEIALLLYKEYIKRKRIPLKKEIEELEDFPSLTTIFRHFKTIKMSEIWEEIFKTRKKYFVKYTLKEKILMQLQNYYLENPDMDKENFRKDKRLYSVETIVKKFGSWNKALVEAGIYESEDENALSKEKIIEQLREHYLKNPNISIESFKKDKSACSPTTVRNKFGSWTNALIEAGIYIREEEKLSEEKIVKQLKQHYLKNLSITVRSFNDDKEVCSSTTVIRMFGSWEKALILAGIYEEKLLKEKMKIIEQLKKHYLKNLSITQKSFEADKSVCSYNTVKNKFGSWNNALLEAGIKEKELKPSKAEIIEDIKKHFLKNFNITQKSFSADKSVCSTSTVIRRFGSWSKALREAGIISLKIK